jgi:hypothetical protein
MANFTELPYSNSHIYGLWTQIVGDRSFGNVAQFKYLGMTLTNLNLIQADIKKRLNSGNACYHSVQNLVFLSAV